MDQKADLDVALKFVVGRIEEQAVQSGEPLTHEQRILLTYLPNFTSMVIAASGPEYLTPIPRDINYEELCALGKTAYLKNLKQNPVRLEWAIASVVFKLNRHPMWSLLQQAGVRTLDHGQMGRIRLCIHPFDVLNVLGVATNRTVAVGERN